MNALLFFTQKSNLHVVKLLLGSSLRKKCESQLAHLSIYTFYGTDHSPAPPAAREKLLLPLSPQSENLFLPAGETLIIVCTVDKWCTICTRIQNAKFKDGPVTHHFVIQRLQVSQ